MKNPPLRPQNRISPLYQLVWLHFISPYLQVGFLINLLWTENRHAAPFQFIPTEVHFVPSLKGTKMISHSTFSLSWKFSFNQRSWLVIFLESTSKTGNSESVFHIYIPLLPAFLNYFKIKNVIFLLPNRSKSIRDFELECWMYNKCKSRYIYH